LVCDVTGSTALGEELDPKVLQGVMNRYFPELRGVIERHAGTVANFIGDAVLRQTRSCAMALVGLDPRRSLCRHRDRPRRNSGREGPTDAMRYVTNVAQFARCECLVP
jgi:hypothetical protein